MSVRSKIPNRIQFAQRFRVLSDSARRLAITASSSSPARGGGQGGGLLRQLQEHILQRLLGDAQFAYIHAARYQAPIDRSSLGGIDRKTEDAIPNLDLARLQQGLEQAL